MLSKIQQTTREIYEVPFVSSKSDSLSPQRYMYRPGKDIVQRTTKMMMISWMTIGSNSLAILFYHDRTFIQYRLTLSENRPLECEQNISSLAITNISILFNLDKTWWYNHVFRVSFLPTWPNYTFSARICSYTFKIYWNDACILDDKTLISHSEYYIYTILSIWLSNDHYQSQ